MEGVYIKGVIKPYGCKSCQWYSAFSAICRATKKSIQRQDIKEGPEWCPITEAEERRNRREEE